VDDPTPRQPQPLRLLDALLAKKRALLAGLERSQHGPSARGEAAPEFAAIGLAELDVALGGGLQRGALHEVLVGEGDALADGSGALELLAPALARTLRPARLLAWIDLARSPYPPTLAQAGLDLARLLLVRPRDAREQAWAIDLALRSGACDVVVARIGRVGDVALRRLQLAAESSGALALLVRPLACAACPSPAATRLEATPLPSVDPRRRRLRVAIRRCRGRGALVAESLELEWSRDPLDELALPALRARAAAALQRGAARAAR
jgi:hypothetical protein